MKHDDDLKNEIYELLEKLKEMDPDLKAFGADEHEYELYEPIEAEELRKIEERYQFKFPADYFWFMTQVGNGGAGPHYGIARIDPDPESDADEVHFWFESAKDMPLDMPIDPLDWKHLIEEVEADEFDEEDWYSRLFGSMILLGQQGDLIFDMMLVNGKDRGRIVYIVEEMDADCLSHFPIEANESFLDWYMGWLREAVQGYDVTNYGEIKLGDPDDIILEYDTEDNAGKELCLASLTKLVKWDERTLAA